MKLNKKQKTPSTYLRILIAIILTLSTTSCDVFAFHFINAVGGIEADYSTVPEFAHLFNRTYEFKKDVILYRFYDECRRNTLHIGFPGTFSDFPKSIELYEQNPEKYDCVKGIVKAGTRFSILRVAKNYSTGGLSFLVIYIHLEGGNSNGGQVEARRIYNFNGPNTGTLQNDWVKISE